MKLTFCVTNSMNIRVYIDLYNHHQNQDKKQFYHCKKLPALFLCHHTLPCPSS